MGLKLNLHRVVIRIDIGVTFSCMPCACMVRQLGIREDEQLLPPRQCRS